MKKRIQLDGLGESDETLADPTELKKELPAARSSDILVDRRKTLSTTTSTSDVLGSDADTIADASRRASALELPAENEAKKPPKGVDMNLFLSARRLVLLSLLVAISLTAFMVWWFADADPKLSKAGGVMGGSSDETVVGEDTVAWGQAWVDCLVAHEDDDPVYGGQAFCSSIPADHVPTYGGWATMEIMSSIIGILYFAALGTSAADWSRVWQRHVTNRKKGRIVPSTSPSRL